MKWSDDSYSPVDINTMSRVPEHPDIDWEVIDILTNLTSGMEVHDFIIDWTCIAEFSFECNLDFKTQHYTECSGTVASKISFILGHVKQGMLWRLHTHTVGNLQSVLDVTTKWTDTSKTTLVCDNISYLYIH